MTLQLSKALTRILFGLAAVCAGGQARPADLSQAISADERIALFARAAVRAGIDKVLRESGPFIVVAPSDRAMVNEGSAFLLKQVLLTEQNAGRLADLVRHHVARSSDRTTNLVEDVRLQTLANVPLEIARVGTGLIVAGHATVTGRIAADNGVIYIVDRLLWPRVVQQEPSAHANDIYRRR